MMDEQAQAERHEVWVRTHIDQPVLGQGEFGPDYWAHHIDVDAPADELFAGYEPPPTSVDDDVFVPPA